MKCFLELQTFQRQLRDMLIYDTYFHRHLLIWIWRNYYYYEISQACYYYRGKLSGCTGTGECEERVF